LAVATGRVLLVDDDPFIAELLDDFLTEEGYTVGVARNGEAALATIRADPPDLVLLDLLLPRMSGEQVLAELARLPVRVPIVLLTASRPLSSWQPPLVADGTLEKPFELDELLAVAERFCPKPRTEAR
jgi:two-component system OmpR family response regulator